MVEVLRSLGPEQRAVVVMRYILEYTPGEIAEILGMPRGTVNSRLRRGLDASRSGACQGRTAMTERKRTEERVRSALLELEAPDEQIAEERARQVVEAAFDGHEPAFAALAHPAAPRSPSSRPPPSLDSR